MEHWQKYVLNCFKKEEFFDVDLSGRTEADKAALRRYHSYNEFVIDTLERYGAIASAILSILFKPKVIVEMGVNIGWTSLLLSKLNPEAIVHGVDIAETYSDSLLPTGFAVQHHKVKNYKLHLMNSWDFSMPGQVDLCFIDADHFLPAVEKDTWRAWDNRNKEGDWCIAWDDYHVNNPDVFNTVNKFVEEVGYPLQKIASWFWIGNKTVSEEELSHIVC